VLSHHCLKFRLAARVAHLGANRTATFQNCRYDSLSVWPATVDLFRTFAAVHIPRLTANKSLIYLDFSSEFVKRLILCSKANPLKHEPRGFLSDTEPTVNLVGANAVLTVKKHPD